MKQFAKFRVGDVLDVCPTIKPQMGVSGYIKDEEVLSLSGVYPYIAAVSENNGVKGWTSVNPSNQGGVITMSTTADSSNTIFYQPVPFVGRQQIAQIRHRDGSSLNRRVALYLATLFQKVTRGFDYGNKLTQDYLKSCIVQLPITDASANIDTPEPDWGYMENYIKTIEQKYIDQISRINTREQEILEQLYPDTVNTKPEAHGFEEFELSEVFEIVTGSLVENLKQGNTPRITPSSRYNGLSLFTEDNNPQARYFEDIVTVSFLGDVFYQPERVSLEMKVHGLRLKEGLGFRKGTYVATSVKKSISERYDYGAQLSSEKLKSIPIELPITSVGDIDWDYMERYIAWIETRERESRKLRAAREEQILTWLHQYH